jgi:hypothetical protein
MIDVESIATKFAKKIDLKFALSNKTLVFLVFHESACTSRSPVITSGDSTPLAHRPSELATQPH